ncbi:unnamed protein product [Caenorhabditis sp. 36 PRJEB53466]|nr:unnamed protein product [Caenorhabditis sp. 36 PRJEB53466]
MPAAKLSHQMVENVPFTMLGDIMRSFSWTVPNGLTLEGLYHRHQLLDALRTRQLVLGGGDLTPPAESPASSDLSLSPTPPSASAAETSAISIVTKRLTKKEKAAAKANDPLLLSPKAADLNRNSYSDCEKKHFLDVAAENNWGTTVAANKFNRVWGRGPTRRMFYWWREQFKKEQRLAKKAVDDLQNRKVELSVELAELTHSGQVLTERSKVCLQQLAAIDSEMATLMSKKNKASFCTITGDPCVHGNGIQDESVPRRKFTNPFVCDFCQMPFQKEGTRTVHMRLCESRHLPQQQEEPSEVSPASASDVDVTDDDALMQTTRSTQNNNNQVDGQRLTELTEELIAQLAAYSRQNL